MRRPLRIIKEAAVIPRKGDDVYPMLVKAGEIEDGERLILVIGKLQRLKVLDGPNVVIKEMLCSTGATGFGNSGVGKGHGATATGLMSIGRIIGAGGPFGMGYRKQEPTGKIHKKNEPGHAEMTTRILTLRGEQPENKSVAARTIYIHGTNKESKLGQPASGGCVRVSNDNVVWLADNIEPGTKVYVLGNPTETTPPLEVSKSAGDLVDDVMKFWSDK